ncbi:tyrosine-type recombinase/integrase [Psychrobacillus sp. MER TA 171]|uniref:tyrosine-type recombinase/integrase n=1 Tax=Psychrobacillus sp. MER TA 171 TaxID=2939577 RepID=UPI00203B78E7|nr:tyrosine-type recombinase/integrase [Psychrobacillus sp. MER TA 171]MCM3359529.1 site-specific integrase [Psychrobacillus sp. MER TA 171]
MYLITERNCHDGIYYEKSFFSEEGEISSKEIVHFRNAKLQYNGIEYVFLYDTEMNPIPETFDYLNFELQDASPNHRYTALTALKFLYCFLELYSLKLESLSKNDIKNLYSFLQGVSKEGTLYQLNLATSRSHSTVKTYTTLYRSFISYLGYKESPLLQKSKNYKLIYNDESDTPMKIFQYDTSLTDYKTEISTPRYISIADLKEILTVIRNEYSIREECIVRLMFENGLRLGELLGLTNEDIVVNEKGNYLYLRNRWSDSPDQLAKGCMNIKNKQQYKVKAYRTKDIGYQIVYLSENLLKKINDYVNEFHLNDSNTFQSNYARFTFADSVENVSNDNFYIFINSIGKPLSGNLWGKTLREIFKKAGLNVDKEQRETNLSHRFRHGYAMFMVKYKKVDAHTLKMLLRHRNINSVKHYYRPTDEEIIEKRTDLVNSIYDVIPELKI